MCDLKHCMILTLLLVMVILITSALTQDTTQTNYESTIKISASIETKEIPLNRKLKFTVIVEWTGDIRRYQISEIDNPVIENFEIFSTSAADRRLSEGGVTKAARIYEFTLKPKSLGMGYIESVIVRYIDNVTGEGHSLITNRISAKVIDPVPEPGSKKNLGLWFLLIGIIILAALLVLWFWQRKIQEQKRKQAETVPTVPLEQEYLTMLRESVNLKSPDINVSNTFWSLSKIIRKYLSQKYQISALESTTEKIVADLANFDIDPAMVNNIQEILTVSDIAKFAGTEGNRSDLDRIYTLTEAILERNLAATKTEKQFNL